jgi:hypothetical protein
VRERSNRNDAYPICYLGNILACNLLDATKSSAGTTFIGANTTPAVLETGFSP